ncbi:hypothetical protein [Nonomuraea salmonea]|uniref:hypothetical protein n=1 Tax=Nonomuraea salmonea TaxID=46181 RepID=UPI0031EAB1FF
MRPAAVSLMGAPTFCQDATCWVAVIPSWITAANTDRLSAGSRISTGSAPVARCLAALASPRNGTAARPRAASRTSSRSG